MLDLRGEKHVEELKRKRYSAGIRKEGKNIPAWFSLSAVGKDKLRGNERRGVGAGKLSSEENVMEHLWIL